MAEENPPFLRIPWEIRDNIYQCVLLDPTGGIFEASNGNTKYQNYLGLMYANKLIYGEVKATLEEIKPLFIISCNIEHLGELMTDHAIPFISDHHAGQVKCHSVRLHVKFPMGKKNAKVLRAYVLLSVHLREACFLLRSLSLTIPHAPGQPTATDGTEFPNMQMSIRLESSGGVPMPTAKQTQFLEQMTWLNHIGKIMMSGCSDEKVRAILPGHDERLPPGTDILQVLARMKKFRMSRYADGMDAIEVASWKNTIATQAFQAKDFRLALDRYLAALDFITKCENQNIYMLQVEGDIQEKLDICSFRAELGLMQSCIGLAKWVEAAQHINIIITGLPERQYVSKKMIACAKALEKQIKKELGASYDPTALWREMRAEEPMVGLSVNDGKVDTSGK